MWKAWLMGQVSFENVSLAISAGSPLTPELATMAREKHGLQCGYCTPGFLMTLIPFLAENPNPTDAQIRDALSGNICRCTGYQNIVEAVKLAAASQHKVDHG